MRHLGTTGMFWGAATVVVLLMSLDPSSSQTSPVYVLNRHSQMVTSSTLLWVSIIRYEIHDKKSSLTYITLKFRFYCKEWV